MKIKGFTKRLLILITALLIAGGISTAAFAGTVPQEKNVRVGYFTMENFMEGGSDGSVQSGFTYELLCEIAAYNHWNIEYIYGDFSDLYKQLAEGTIDILPNVIDTEERKQQVLFHSLTLNTEHYYISAPGEDGGPEPSVLNGKSLATVKGAYEERYFDEWARENSISMEKVYCSGYDEAWEVVRTGKADYILNINNTAPGPGFSPLFEVGQHGVYFAAAEGRADIIADMDYALRMIEDVSPFLITDLKEKYLNDALTSYQLSPEEKAWLKEHSVIRIGGLKNDIPYAYENEDGRIVGTYVELTELILGKLGIDSLEVQWSLYPTMSELRAALKSEELDLICPEYHSYNAAEKNGFTISETVMNIPMGLLALGNVSLDGMDSIATGGERPGLVYVNETFPDAKVLPMDNVAELVKAVKDGRVSGAIAHIYALQEEIRSSKTEYTLSPLSAPCLICYASLEQNNGLIMMINRGYHLIDQAERNSIEVRYGTIERDLNTARDFLKKNMEAIAVLIGCVIIVSTYAVFRSLTAGKLKNNLEEITQKNAIIEASRIELEAAKEKAQMADRAKTSFLFNMSHDIRTPMNAIIGFNNIARSHIDDREIVLDSLNKVDISSKQLLSLINDVLDMARIESGTVTCDFAPADIIGTAADLIDMVNQSTNKQLTVETDFGAVDHRFVMADVVHLNSILTNVISNSVKYTPEGGTIRFTVAETLSGREGVYAFDFVIEDNGIGMSEEFLSHIYEEFAREKNSTVSGIQGTGLGMAITKRLTELMGGSIDIQSKLGEGTKTTIHLEMEAADPDAVSHDTANTSVNGNILKGKKVLLVEDNELNREIAEDILSEAGMQIDTAEDGDIAVEKMKNADAGRYDLILMDIQMPRMNGYEATMAIRALPDARASSIPIVAMTANAFEEDKQNAFASGMNGHIAKPIAVPELLNTLAGIMQE